MEVGRRVGRQLLFHLCRAAQRPASQSTATLGTRPGAKIQMRSTVIKPGIMGKKNGVKSGVNQASSLGARSGLAVCLKT